MEGKAKVALTFALYQGDALVRRETVTQDIVKVGKDPKSHLRVDDELASRMHAVIEVAGARRHHAHRSRQRAGHDGQRRARQQVQDPRPAIRSRSAAPTIVLESAEPRRGRGGSSRRRRARPFAAMPARRRRNPFAAPAADPFARRVGEPVRCAPAANPFAAAPANPFALGMPLVDRGQPRSAHGRSHGAGRRAARARTRTRSSRAGPTSPADEVEIRTLQSVEVMVLWDTKVLHVSHLTPPRSFYVGEEEGKNFTCDYFIPQREARHDARAGRRRRSRRRVARRDSAARRGHDRDPRPAEDDGPAGDRSRRTQPCAELSGRTR